MIEDVVFLNYSFIEFKFLLFYFTQRKLIFCSPYSVKNNNMICLALLLIKLKKKKTSREALDYLLLSTVHLFHYTCLMVNCCILLLSDLVY